jgi:Mg-chelatase subunit ChlD
MATLELPAVRLAEFRTLEADVAAFRGATARGTAGAAGAAGGVVFGHATLADGTPALLLEVPKNALHKACRGLVFLLDESSSMLHDWHAMLAALRDVLAALCVDEAYGATYVAFLTFSTGARVRVGACRLEPGLIDDMLRRLYDFGGGNTHVEEGLALADLAAQEMLGVLERDGAHATPAIVVVTDGDPTDEELAARALAATRAPVHVVAFGAQYKFGTCDAMFKYTRRGSTAMLFTHAARAECLVGALAGCGAHGVSVVGLAGSRCHYNGAVVDFEGAHVVVVDPRAGLRVGFTGPVDIATLSLYGAKLDAAPSVPHGMQVRDFLVATAVTEFAQKLALDSEDASAVLLRRTRGLVERSAPTLAPVLSMLSAMLGDIERGRESADSGAVARAVSGAVRAFTCPS